MFWRKKENYAVTAVDVGTSKIAVAVGELRPDGSLVLLGVGESAVTGIRKGEIVDFQLAQQAIERALVDAEAKTECMIKYVYLNLSGAHLEPRVIRLKTAIDGEDHRITAEHVERLARDLEDYAIPAEHEIIHSAVQHYYIDNNAPAAEPIGLSSRTLEASYHIVHGLRTRLETLFRCVMELDVEVVHYALSSYASAQAILTKQQKGLGAVVIDMGAGVTDYLVYADGAVAHSGVLAVGGDHVTQDLALGLKLPFAKAEELKTRHGNLYADGARPNARLTIPKDTNTDERNVYVESLAKIMHLRVRETLELVHEEIERKGLWSQVSGHVYLTGGASQVAGLLRLAGEIFPAPARLAREFSLEGDQTYNQRPDLATALGLLRYAQHYDLTHERATGWTRLRHSMQDLLARVGLF
ncbi:MAG: cell division protein FtsA [Verrucomicrobiales bacterium]|jgi:cell division protein FtsA|nr:cell division protein FtsA [Verrucomicrobiales bacterium]